MKQKIAITGANGFIGSQVIQQLSSHHDIIALTRSGKPQTEANIEWRKCDLFSLLQAEHALKGADVAFYLVHSMMPMARLTQASFEDMDLILADNFARAAKHNGVKQIIYLGGIIPDNPMLSRHLHSRLEVEQTLASHGVPVTTLRASIIVGAQGSSFQIVEKLVRRLPMMICPQWTQSLTQPIALKDVLEVMDYIIAKPHLYHQSFDIGGPDIVTYLDLLKRTARAMQKRRLIVSVPFLSASLSRFWVCLITQAPKELIAPLIESLKDAMVARDVHLQNRMGQLPIPLNQALAESFNAPLAMRARAIRARRRQGLKNVRSVQRIPLPPNKDAIWLAEKYTIWLPRYFRPFIRVEVNSLRVIRFYIFKLPLPLLELTYSEERSTPDRTLFYITGGILATHTPGMRGRLEFREVLNGQCALAAIHDFTPSLPWFIYNYTQARLHLWVMQAFVGYMRKLDVPVY